MLALFVLTTIIDPNGETFHLIVPVVPRGVGADFQTFCLQTPSICSEYTSKNFVLSLCIVWLSVIVRSVTAESCSSRDKWISTLQKVGQYIIIQSRLWIIHYPLITYPLLFRFLSLTDCALDSAAKTQISHHSVTVALGKHQTTVSLPLELISHLGGVHATTALTSPSGPIWITEPIVSRYHSPIKLTVPDSFIFCRTVVVHVGLLKWGNTSFDCTFLSTLISVVNFLIYYYGMICLFNCSTARFLGTSSQLCHKSIIS